MTFNYFGIFLFGLGCAIVGSALMNHLWWARIMRRYRIVITLYDPEKVRRQALVDYRLRDAIRYSLINNNEPFKFLELPITKDGASLTVMLVRSK